MLLNFQFLYSNILNDVYKVIYCTCNKHVVHIHKCEKPVVESVGFGLRQRLWLHLRQTGQSEDSHQGTNAHIYPFLSLALSATFNPNPHYG
jgi:hypothetical protein